MPDQAFYLQLTERKILSSTAATAIEAVRLNVTGTGGIDHFYMRVGTHSTSQRVPFHSVFLFTRFFNNDGSNTLLVDQRMPEAFA
ncbi:hypothetical protein [Chitinophaga sp.]|uniref:hypothetical protein n=1 Tax=Chitinophaga sp. TaxID=1869181 RepID=UPI002F94AEB2